MDYSVDQAKSIFTLLHDATWYAIPLILALLFPLIWVLFKKLLGITNNSMQPASNNTVFDGLGRFFSLQGDFADELIFYSCLVLFLFGLWFLKHGEKQEETIRLKALSLQQFFIANDRLFYDRRYLPKNFTENNYKLLDDIVEEFPKQFLYRDNVNSGINVDYVDSIYLERYQQKINPILSAYIDHLLLTRDNVNVFDLFKGDNYLQNLFIEKYVYGFFASKDYATKYYLDIVNGQPVVLKREKEIVPIPAKDAQPKASIEQNANSQSVKK